MVKYSFQFFSVLHLSWYNVLDLLNKVYNNVVHNVYIERFVLQALHIDRSLVYIDMIKPLYHFFVVAGMHFDAHIIYYSCY